MAKTQILDYYIHLTDKSQVDTYQDQLANPAALATASPGGIGSPALFIPATGTYAILRAPDAAAVEFSAPIQNENVTFAAPCTRSPWFIPGANNFPRNVASFTRKSGGWFGVPALWGQTTKFYWAGHFVYAPSPTAVIDGDDKPVAVPAPIPVRRWIDGMELPIGGEGQFASSRISTEASRLLDAQFGYVYRRNEASADAFTHQFTTATAPSVSWERFYLRVRRLPDVDAPVWEARNFATTGEAFVLYVTPGGQFALYHRTSSVESAKVLLGTGGTVALNSWARIDCVVHYFAETGPPVVSAGQCLVFLNGTKILSASFSPSGIAGNVIHISSSVGKNVSLAVKFEGDFDDWMNARPPALYDPSLPGWSGSSTVYAVGDLVLLVPSLDKNGSHNLGRLSLLSAPFEAYKCVTAHTSTISDADFPRTSTKWVRLGDSPDWLLGSRLVIVRPIGDASDRSGWTGDVRLALQRPVEGTVGTTEELTSTTPNARFSVTTDAVQQIMRAPGVRGIAGFIVGANSQRSLTGGPKGQLGYRLNGGASVMATVIDGSGALAWAAKDPAATGVPAVLHNLADPSAPLTVTALDLILDRDSNATGTAKILSLHAVVEALGLFGNEDVPPGTVDKPTFPVLRTGTHNRWVARSPWAQNTSRAHAPVVLVGGTYVGNGTAQDLTFRLPPHFVWIRRVTGTGDLGVRWWPSMLCGHQDLREGLHPAEVPQALIDPAFTPAGGEDDQAQRYLLRIVGGDAQINASGVTYQYIALCDPAARFLLTHAVSHDGSSVTILPSIDALPDASFTPETAFFWRENRSNTGTDSLTFKGIGHAASDAGVELPGTADTDIATFGTGTVTIRVGLFNALDYEQIAMALFRRNDGNNDPNAAKILSLLNYTGDGLASRVLTFTPAPGVRPLFAVVVGNNSHMRDPSNAAAASTNLGDGTETATGITAGGLGTITVGVSLNTSGIAYNVIVFWGSATAGPGGWSINGEFIPVEPDSTKPPSWTEPTEITTSAVGGVGTSGTAPAIGDGPVLDTPDLNDDLADAACVGPTTKVVNMALGRIGVNKPIVTLATEASPEAEQVRLVYDLALQATLRDRAWPFATRYATLTLLAGTATTPANGDWQYAYRLPDDALYARRLVTGRGTAVDPTPPPFRLGTGVLFTNEVGAKLEYTARVACPARITDATFLNAWAWRLAHELAPALSRMPDRAQQCWAMYQAVLEAADTFLRLGSPGTRPAADPADPDALCAAVKLKVINIGLVRIGAHTIADLANEQSREAVAASLVYEDELKATLRDFPWAFATRYADPLTLVRGPAWDTATVQAWSSTQAYVAGDTVKQAGTVYYCVLAHTNQVPPNATYWTTTPTTEANADWTYAYRLPSDSLLARRLVRRGTGRTFDPNPPQYRLGSDDPGGLIFADEQDPVLEYTVRPKCALSIGDALFRDACAWRMAAVLAPSLAAVEPDAAEQTGRTPDPSTPRRSEGGALRLQQLREQRARWAWGMYQRALLIAEASHANEQQPARTDEGDADWIRGR